MAIFCGQCGKESAEEARFCSACGRPLIASASAPGQPFNVRQFGSLVRPRAGRKVAGVCQGLSNLYGWEVSIVRVVMLLLAIVTFPLGFIIYGLIWLIAPEELLALPSSNYVNQS